jgi:hypothetical protein
MKSKKSYNSVIATDKEQLRYSNAPEILGEK